MYGMIHRAVRQMIYDQLGEEAWQALERKLDIGPTELLTAMVYDDEVTFRIVGEASARLNLSIDECLFAFGQYWIKYAESGSLAPIMNFTGATLPSFIDNLDRLHLAVGAAMPGARLPNFTMLEHDAGRIVVEYRSERTGMDQFVSGLFHGLMLKFHTKGSVSLLNRTDGALVFEILYQDEG